MLDLYFIKRRYHNGEATLGTFTKGCGDLCKTLENPWIGNLPEISCIPEGEYTCVKDDTGRFRYWKVLNVPGRNSIEIHNGNTSRDTLGCILFGQSWGKLDGELAIFNSIKTLKRMKELLPDKFKLIITKDE